ncbi:MAG: carboxypeptidase-like regulatory domain-containing protein [Elusimicrobiota bacterium]
MKCPNCQFDIKESVETCPFCSFVLPVDEEAEQDNKPPDLPSRTEQTDPAAPSLIDLDGADVDPEVGRIPKRPEDAAGAAPEPVQAPEPKPSAMKSILTLLVAAAIGFGGYHLGLFDNLLSLAGITSAAPQPEAQTARPGPDAPRPAPPSPAALPTSSPASAGGPIEEEPHQGPAGSALVDPRMAALLQDQTAAIQVEQPPPPEPEGDWVFLGTVYDMITLKPIRDAQMLFLSGSAQTDYDTTTDAKGRYRIRLPASTRDDYRLIIDHPDYLADYFDEKSPSYRTVSLAVRQQLRSAKPKLEAWKGVVGKNARRDIVLFPEIPDRNLPPGESHGDSFPAQ